MFLNLTNHPFELWSEEQRKAAKGIKCVASTTERDTVMTPDGKKISQFKFVQFREY